jgi:hypothetical protein
MDGSRPDESARTQQAAAWQEFEQDEPELATRIRERFAANLHHVLGTVRPDGAPRLSGTEVSFRDGEVAIGMMSGSHKLRDVRRDPRVELHSAPLEDDLANGDAKIAGIVLPAHEEPGGAAHFLLRIRLASLVRVVGDELELAVWRPSAGARTVRRR